MLQRVLNNEECEEKPCIAALEQVEGKAHVCNNMMASIQTVQAHVKGKPKW